MLTVGVFCLQWESVSNKGLKGLSAKKLNCKQKTSTVSKHFAPFHAYVVISKIVQEQLINHGPKEGFLSV